MLQTAMAPSNRSWSTAACAPEADARRQRAMAYRSDRAAPRDRFRAAPETTRSATRQPADRRRACVVATTASACRAVVGEGGALARRSRESARRTTTLSQADEARGLRLHPDRAEAATDRAGSPLQETERRNLRRPT